MLLTWYRIHGCGNLDMQTEREYVEETVRESWAAIIEALRMSVTPRRSDPCFVSEHRSNGGA
jgi:RecB family exonuclease